MKRVVLDASVAAKWYLRRAEEAHVSESLLLQGEHVEGRIRLVVPEIFWAEMGSILWKAVNQRRLPAEDAAESLENIQSFGLESVSNRSLLMGAWRLSRVYGRSLYDCLYVELAREVNSDFVTADERLVNAVGTYLPVRWLGAWRP